MPTARLDDRGVVAVTGEDARHFLDNLLSNDAPAGADAPTFAALLTPQGKILADMIVHAVPDGFLLDMRRDMLAALRARLGLYKLRAQVTIAEASGLAVFAAWGQAAEGRLPDPRLPMLGARFVSAPEAVAPDATTNDFHRHRLALGVPEAGLDFPFSDVFPHEAGMDALHGVSFTKGCYIGQEVVSRMKHRGTARTRPVVVTAEAALPDPGAEITAGERVIGRLGMSFSGSGADGRRVALVRLDRAAEAKAAGLPIRAGATDVSLALPSWATWGWPASEPASSGGAAS